MENMSNIPQNRSMSKRAPGSFFKELECEDSFTDLPEEIDGIECEDAETWTFGGTDPKSQACL